MNLDGKKIIIDNKEWLVIETVQYDNNYYVYMVNKDNTLDSMYGIVKVEEQLVIDSIEPILFRKEILPLFLEKFQTEIE